MNRPLATLLATLALAACTAVRPPPRKPPVADAPAPAPRPHVASGAQGELESGRLTAADQAVVGPFVLTYLAPGAELALSGAGAPGLGIGTVVGPLAAPFHLAAGASLRPVATEVVYAGYRPLPITRALEAYVGRQIWVSQGPAGALEQWSLREIGGDHLTLERSRSYRVIPVRRVSEISWTELTGIDPTPRVVLAPE
jgi:hypothetical protein